MILPKVAKQPNVKKYVPFMGTLTEQQIAGGMERFVKAVKTSAERAKALESLSKSSNLNSH